MAQLTEQEWERVLPLLENVKAERRQAAYNRLVKGMTLAKAGEPYGYTRQDVSELASRVLDKHAKLTSIPQPAAPRGWVRIELVVPRRHVIDVRRMVEALYPPPQTTMEQPPLTEVRPTRSRDGSSR